MPWNTTAKKCCSPGDIEAEYREALAGAQTIVAQAAEVAETYEPHTSKVRYQLQMNCSHGDLETPFLTSSPHPTVFKIFLKVSEY